MKIVLALAGTVLALGACAADDQRSVPAPEAASTSTPALVTLVEACPLVENVLIATPASSTNAQAWKATLDAIQDVSAASDIESQNAFDLLRPGLVAKLDAALGYVLPASADIDYTQSVDDFARRCEAAGSSAFS